MTDLARDTPPHEPLTGRLSDAQLEAIRVAEVKAGLDWTLENAHPLLMAVGPLVDELRDLRRRLAEVEAERDQARHHAETAEAEAVRNHELHREWFGVDNHEDLTEVWRQQHAALGTVERDRVHEFAQAQHVDTWARAAAAEAHIARVEALHHPITVQGYPQSCTDGECDHPDQCPEVDYEVCAHCYELAELGEPEIYHLGEVGYPCATAKALAVPAGEHHDGGE